VRLKAFAVTVTDQRSMAPVRRIFCLQLRVKEIPPSAQPEPRLQQARPWRLKIVAKRDRSISHDIIVYEFSQRVDVQKVFGPISRVTPVSLTGPRGGGLA